MRKRVSVCASVHSVCLRAISQIILCVKSWEERITGHEKGMMCGFKVAQKAKFTVEVYSATSILHFS